MGTTKKKTPKKEHPTLKIAKDFLYRNPKKQLEKLLLKKKPAFPFKKTPPNKWMSLYESGHNEATKRRIMEDLLLKKKEWENLQKQKNLKPVPSRRK